MSEHGATASAPARPLYEAIEQIRLKRGLSTIEMAELAGVSRSTIAKWKTSKGSPEARTVKDVAERLGIDHDEALRLAGLIKQPPRHLASAPEAEAVEEREYPEFVGDDEMFRHIWDGPGTDEEREHAIGAVAELRRQRGGGVAKQIGHRSAKPGM